MENLQLSRQRPGNNLAKFILLNTTVMNLIVETILGSEANDHYAPRPFEWPYDTIFATWYLPISAEFNFPPVLIEVQHTVDNDFIRDLIECSISPYEQDKRAPVIITFVVSSMKYQVSKRTISDKKLPFLLRYPCKPWAQSCYFVDASSLQSGSTLHLPPLVALSHFLIGQHPSLSVNPFNTDPTIQLLYSIAERGFGTEGKRIVQDILQLCQQTDDTITRALSTLMEDVPDIAKWRRTKKVLEDGRRTVQLYKQKYEAILHPDNSSSLNTFSDNNTSTIDNHTANA